MSFVNVAIVLVATTVVSTGVSIYSAIAQGEAADNAAKTKADQEEFAAKDREITRRKQLLKAMASQNAMSAAGGVRAYEGSQLNMLKSDMGNYAYDASMDRGTTDTNKAWMLYGGRVAKNTGYLGAAASGISAIGSLASLGKPSAGGDTSGNNLASRNPATGGFNTRRG
jgi:hypothetical protein